MAVDVSLANSPYLAPQPRPQVHAEDGLGYSRHYAQRIRNLGRSSKESWIKRLWNHMFSKNNPNSPYGASKSKDQSGQSIGPHSSGAHIGVGTQGIGKAGSGATRGEKATSGGKGTSRSAEGANKDAKGSSKNPVLPPIRKESTLVGGPARGEGHHVQFSKSQSDGGGGGSEKSYKEKADVHRDSTKSAPQPQTGPSSSVSSSSITSTSARDAKGKMLIPAELAHSPYIPPKDRPNYKVQPPDKAKDSSRLPNRSRSDKDSMFLIPKPSHPYLSTHQEQWRPRLARASTVINLEKRAKSTADQAMKGAKIFICDGPYPVDAYVRFSLRKRGWVEKFGQKANNASRIGTSSKLGCQQEEDFEAICDQMVPAPWEEEHGLHAIMSRVVRHYPAKFIWGGRAVNNLIIRSEVMTNHFPKARYFSSKCGLASSLRELPWQNDMDPMEFFPRCYLLNDTDKDDMIEDFRLSACMCIMKLVIKMYVSKKGEKDDVPKLHRENTKYEEVTSQREAGPHNDGQVTSIFERVKKNSSGVGLDEYKDKEDGNCDPEQMCNETDNDLPSSDPNKPEEGGANENSDLSSQSKSSFSNDGVIENDNQHHEAGASVGQSGANEDVLHNDQLEERDALGEDFYDKGEEPDKANLAACDNATGDQSGSDEPVRPRNGEKVMPDLRSTRKEKTGGEVPSRAVDWALLVCDRFLRSKCHEDIDSKKKGLAEAQYTQLLDWFYQISQNGATVPVTEGQLRDCEDTLHRMRRVWPQHELDGDKNIWIAKPGDKSKGIGIEFCDKLSEIVKYIGQTASNYVVQKYIERPLLIYQCKFDFRLWFLVTEWNPLTVWVYKDCYLRICSQEFSYDTMHESVHLSNVAVQQNYQNGTRSDKLPDNNFMTSNDFKTYLEEIGEPDKWDNVIFPGMKNAVISCLIATQDVAESRKSAFELYGADFMLSEDFRPWLLEINSCPGMAPTSVEKAKLCASVIDDTLKVVLDRKENRNCATGNFELALRDNAVPQVKCVDTKFLLEGQRIKRLDLQKYMTIDQNASQQEKDREKKEREKLEKEKREKEQKEKGDQNTEGVSDTEATQGEGQPAITDEQQESTEEHKKDDERGEQEFSIDEDIKTSARMTDREKDKKVTSSRQEKGKETDRSARKKQDGSGAGEQRKSETTKRLDEMKAVYMGK